MIVQNLEYFCSGLKSDITITLTLTYSEFLQMTNLLESDNVLIIFSLRMHKSAIFVH